MLRTKLGIKKYVNSTSLFVLFFFGLNSALTIYLFTKHGLDNKVALICILAIEILIESLLLFFYFKLSRKKASLEKIFLTLYIPLGLLFIVFMPPQQSPDSYAHLTRAFEISNGALITSASENNINGAILPVEIRHYATEKEDYEYELANINTQLSGETYLEQEYYPSASGYNFILYAPHVLGILIGKILHLPLYFILMLGRITCMLTFGFMAFLAIKFAPKFKLFLAFIALMPMTLQQTTSYTVDAVTIGVAFLLFGYALHLTLDDIGKLSRKQILAIYALCVTIALCKIVYFPLAGLFILVPWKKFGSKARKWVNLAIVVFISIAIELLWMVLQPTRQGTVIFNDQFEFILSQPFSYAVLIIGTLVHLSSFYINSTFGMSLGSWEFHIPEIYLFLALAVSVCVFVKYIDRSNIPAALRRLSWAIFIASMVGFMTAMFTQWTKPGTNYVNGVQGRYFIPIIPLIPVMFSSFKNRKQLLIQQPLWPLLFNAFFCICGVITIIMTNLGR